MKRSKYFILSGGERKTSNIDIQSDEQLHQNLPHNYDSLSNPHVTRWSYRYQNNMSDAEK